MSQLLRKYVISVQPRISEVISALMSRLNEDRRLAVEDPYPAVQLLKYSSHCPEIASDGLYSAGHANRCPLVYSWMGKWVNVLCVMLRKVPLVQSAIDLPLWSFRSFLWLDRGSWLFLFQSHSRFQDQEFLKPPRSPISSCHQNILSQRHQRPDLWSHLTTHSVALCFFCHGIYRTLCSKCSMLWSHYEKLLFPPFGEYSGVSAKCFAADSGDFLSHFIRNHRLSVVLEGLMTAVIWCHLPHQVPCTSCAGGSVCITLRDNQISLTAGVLVCLRHPNTWTWLYFSLSWQFLGNCHAYNLVRTDF